MNVLLYIILFLFVGQIEGIYNVYRKLCTLLDLEALGSSHYSSFAFHILNDIEKWALEINMFVMHTVRAQSISKFHPIPGRNR
jgi:hypothetical protein